MAHRSHRLPLRPLVALVFVVALLALPALAAAQGDDSSLAQERYYSSYGQPTTTTPAPAPAEDGPGWTLVVLGGAALLLAGVAFGAVGGRTMVRPRGAGA